MVFALAGDSTTTTFINPLYGARSPLRDSLGGCAIKATQIFQRKETRLPGWRSTRPASSSSSKRVATAAADKWHWRTSSSTATGVGPNLSVISSSAASSATGGCVPADGQSITTGGGSDGRGGGGAAGCFSCAP